MKTTLYIITLICILIIGIILNGYAFSVIWLWFLVPLKLPPITIQQAIIIIIMLRWVTYQNVETTEQTKDKTYIFGAVIGYSILSPLLFLALGKILLLF